MTVTKVVARQVLLSLAALLILLLVGAGLALCFTGDPSWPVVILGSLLMLTGIFAPMLMWFLGEDDCDIEPEWIVPMTIVSLCLTAVLPFALWSTYLETYGDRVPVVVTADVSGESGGGVQAVQVTRLSNLDDLGELSYTADHDLKAGEHLEARVDPRGWVGPDTGQGFEPRARIIGYVLATAGFGGLLLLTVLRSARDVRRVRRTGTRRYTPSATYTSPTRRSEDREDLPDVDLPDADDVREHVGHGHGGHGGHGGHDHDWGDSGGDSGGDAGD